ncbi:MAG: DUF5828 family protein [Halobacteriaceae archaeon]
MYGDILHPTDGSRGTRAAADRAVDLAERFDATLHVLSVVDERAEGPSAAAGDRAAGDVVPGDGAGGDGAAGEDDGPEPPVDDSGGGVTDGGEASAVAGDADLDRALVESATGEAPSRSAAARDAVATVADEAAAAGVGAVEGTVARGRPSRAICAYADDRAVDLLVMGTHGRTGLERHLLGSVTESVVRRTDRPVLVVGLGGRWPAERPPVEERVSGFRVAGSWDDVVAHGERVASALAALGADPEALREFEEWRPKRHEFLEAEVSEKTVERASLGAGAGEDAGHPALADLEETVEDALAAIDVAREDGPGDVVERFEDAIEHAVRAADTGARRAFRTVERAVYEEVMTRFTPYYFDNDLVSADVEHPTRVLDGAAYVFEVDVHDDALKADLARRLETADGGGT